MEGEQQQQPVVVEQLQMEAVGDGCMSAELGVPAP
jgi:hypothetical protein